MLANDAYRNRLMGLVVRLARPGRTTAVRTQRSAGDLLYVAVSGCGDTQPPIPTFAPSSHLASTPVILPRLGSRVRFASPAPVSLRNSVIWDRNRQRGSFQVERMDHRSAAATYCSTYSRLLCGPGCPSAAIGGGIGYPATDLRLAPTAAVLAQLHFWRKRAVLHLPING